MVLDVPAAYDPTTHLFKGTLWWIFELSVLEQLSLAGRVWLCKPTKNTTKQEVDTRLAKTTFLLFGSDRGQDQSCATHIGERHFLNRRLHESLLRKTGQQVDKSSLGFLSLKLQQASNVTNTRPKGGPAAVGSKKEVSARLSLLGFFRIYRPVFSEDALLCRCRHKKPRKY